MKSNNKLLSNSVATDTVLCKRTVHHKFCSHIPLITKSIPNTYLGKNNFSYFFRNKFIPFEIINSVSIKTLIFKIQNSMAISESL